jgi:hypothetical protein
VAKLWRIYGEKVYERWCAMAMQVQIELGERHNSDRTNIQKDLCNDAAEKDHTVLDVA